MAAVIVGLFATPAHATTIGVHQARPRPSSFVGLSLEYSKGGISNYANPKDVNLLHQLDPHPTLRIGGDSTDWYSLKVAQSAAWRSTPEGFATATDAQLIMGVNFKAQNISATLNEASTLTFSPLNPRITGLEIGNEPELYHHVRSAAYLPKFNHYIAALHGYSLIGPASGSAHWVAKLPSDTQTKLQQTTYHFYALNACVHQPKSQSYPAIAHLLSPFAVRLAVAPLVARAHSNGSKFRIDELNSVTCRGKHGVADSPAFAIWMTDVLTKADHEGVDGVNIHMWPGAPSEQLFTGTSVHPEYYGALMFTKFAPTGSRLLNTYGATSADTHVWATTTENQIRVMAINKSRTRKTFTLNVRGGTASVQTLSGTTLQTQPDIEKKDGVFKITLPWVSEALLTIH